MRRLLDTLRRQIRLFVLDAEVRDARLTGRLATYSLDDSLYHCALSHAWGQPSYLGRLSVDSEELPMTASLYDALKQLRNPRDKTAI